MAIFRSSAVITLLLTIFDGAKVISSESVKLVGPKCGGVFDGGKEVGECGTSITLDPATNFDLGSLCKNADRLKLGVVREDADIEGIVVYIISTYHDDDNLESFEICFNGLTELFLISSWKSFGTCIPVKSTRMQ